MAFTIRIRLFWEGLTATKNKPRLLHATFYDSRVSCDIASHSIEELQTIFGAIEIPFELEDNEHIDSVSLLLVSFDGQSERKLKFELRPDYGKWAKTYSIEDYAHALRRAVKNLRTRSVKYFQAKDTVLNGFGIECRIASFDATLEQEVQKHGATLKRVCGEAETFLAATVRQNSITTVFSFPPQIKTACEQYLLYFVQFLEDLGIVANAEVKEQLQKVLFSVTPVAGPDALEKVREALEIYLRLPTAPNFDAAAAAHPDLAVQHLHANILHLQSQLTLAKATMQAQSAAINSLQLTNFQLKQLLPAEKGKSAASDEPIFGDTVHVTELEAKGLKVNLPLILRRLKRVFGVGQKKN